MNACQLLTLVESLDSALAELVAAHDEAAEQSSLPSSVYVASCKLLYLFRRLERLALEPPEVISQ
ncbi:MAG TPA: hypothetical protein P5102_12650 [Candidatus Competibacteraceae bacterium]|nr:hypothetical protein [Candidatus Competibacteraceae bacterium]HRZ06970.1 hypothetical protein [Candidatus Competibacteraceae bacterium]HSA45468.1 hypothetical protein [Candidatus Competibacteraceae bacterium]